MGGEIAIATDRSPAVPMTDQSRGWRRRRDQIATAADRSPADRG
jgi:hypothetical protein